ncbi:MAG: glycosyltransferase family 2 protein [Phycisphaeraceae bacterium]|nr:glycosyltransferase family 2 protein [Phycisphaeraceae bacterium]
MTISVVVNTLNSQKYLDPCLTSVAGADEIVVCDMHSTDQTLEIAARHGCRIVFHEPTGFVEPARNFAIGQATGEWILVVDSDEIIPPALWDYLVAYAARPDAAEALRIPRKNIALGRFLWCRYPTQLIRFFRRGCVDWPAVVHIAPTVDGRMDSISPQRLDLAIIHYNYDSIEQCIARMNTYTSLEVEKFRRRGEKFSAWKMILRSVNELFKRMIHRRGYRDGMHGVVFVGISVFYQFLAMAKLWEAELRDRERASAPGPVAPTSAPAPTEMVNPSQKTVTTN